MKLAYSSLACPAWTVEQAADAVERYGYEGIEWRLADGEVLSAQTPKDVRERVIRATRERNLSVACLDTSCQFVQATPEQRETVVRDAQAMVDLAVELGAPYVRVFGGAIPEGLSQATILAPTAEALRRAADYAATQGVTILLETHDAWSSSRDALALVETAGSPTLAILWDVHHPYRMGETPQQTCHTLRDGQIVAHVHIKDARRLASDPTAWQLTLLEEGEVPVKAAVDILRYANYSGFLSVEWEKKWHPEIAEPEIALPQFAAIMRRYLDEP